MEASAAINALQNGEIDSMSVAVADRLKQISNTKNLQIRRGYDTRTGVFIIGRDSTLFKDDAARNSVLLFHRDGAHTVDVSRVRLDRLQHGDDLADQVVGRFDIIFVPRSTIGRIDIFAQQFIAPVGGPLSTALVGWELFNLDRVCVTRVVRE
jgi:hypothetical protein